MGSRTEEDRALACVWDDEVGDRRQKLFFIGQDLDPAAVRAVLDPALLDDAEFAAGRDHWRALPDPLSAWQVSSDGYVHDHAEEFAHG